MNASTSQPPVVSRPHPLWAAILLALAVSLLGAGVFALSRPSQYQAVARIRLAVPPPAGGEVSVEGVPVARDPYRLQNEIERVRSESVLLPVVKRLGLAVRWGRGGESLTAAEALETLEGRVETRMVRNAWVCQVMVTSAAPAEASELANAVAESYCNGSLEQHRRRAASGLQALERSLAEQNGRVGGLERRLAAVAAQGTEGGAAGEEVPVVNLLLSSNLPALHAEVESRLLLIESQRESLRGLEGADLLQAVTTIIPGEIVLPRLQLDLAEAEQDLARLRADASGDAAEIRQTEALCATIERQIAERLHGILNGLEARLTTGRAQREVLLKRLADQREQATADFQWRAEAAELARELENEQRIRDSLARRVMQERLDAQAPEVAPAAVVEFATLPLRPVRSAPARGGMLLGAGVLALSAGMVLRRPGVPGKGG